MKFAGDSLFGDLDQYKHFTSDVFKSYFSFELQELKQQDICSANNFPYPQELKIHGW